MLSQPGSPDHLIDLSNPLHQRLYMQCVTIRERSSPPEPHPSLCCYCRESPPLAPDDVPLFSFFVKVLIGHLEGLNSRAAGNVTDQTLITEALSSPLQTPSLARGGGSLHPFISSTDYRELEHLKTI